MGLHGPKAGVPAIERFLEKIEIDKETECWNWTAGKDKDGYGKFQWNKRLGRSHRFSYEHYIGEIPDKLLVCHTCDNTSCNNPKHLFLGTPLINARDMINKGRMKFPEPTPHPSMYWYVKMKCRCTECVEIYNKSRENTKRQDYKDARNAKRREEYKLNPTTPKQKEYRLSKDPKEVSEKRKAYYNKNKERILANQRKWRDVQEHKDRLNSSKRAKYDPEKMKIQNRNKYLRMKERKSSQNDNR